MMIQQSQICTGHSKKLFLILIIIKLCIKIEVQNDRNYFEISALLSCERWNPEWENQNTNTY